MTAVDLELRVRHWLAADAATAHAPAALRARVLEIPASQAPAQGWWHRFAMLPAWSASIAGALVVAVVLTTTFFNLFDAPVGADGEPCNDRQIQRALDLLRDADGYRYIQRDQIAQLDPDVELSFDAPQYAWMDAWTSEAAYLAPDRARDVRTFSLPERIDPYVEHLQIGSATYQLREVDGAEAWVVTENWPSANLLYLYIMGAFPDLTIPPVAEAGWRATPVPDALPGVEGCVAAAMLPVPQPPGEQFEPIPSHMIPQRIVALRVDVADGRPTGIYLGPSVGGVHEGDMRSIFEISWTTPDADEFVEPAETIADPDRGFGVPPPPTPAPPSIGAGAWVPATLPGGTGTVNAVATGERFVAVGASYDTRAQGLIWTSSDGRTWEPAGDAEAFRDLDFQRVAWDGATFLAIAYRPIEDPSDPRLSMVRPEAWLSADGLTWERGGDIGPGEGSGETAIPRALMAGGPGWVVGGAVSSTTDNQQRPAFFTSVDGSRWTTVELEDTGSGSIERLAELPDGRLFATGCESPGTTNSGTFGLSCYMRPWQSKDGMTWTPGGGTFEFFIGGVAPWDGELVAVTSDDGPPPGMGHPQDRLMTSPDGVVWTELPGFSSGDGVATDIHVIGNRLVVYGQLPGAANPFATAWQSSDGTAWEPIPLGLPAGGTGSFITSVIDTPSGIAFLGWAQVDERQSVPLIWTEP